MTEKSYDKDYLPAAQRNLGAMIDVAVYYLDYTPAAFFEKFLRSEYSVKIERGDPFTIWGKSGTEIAFAIDGRDIGEYKEKLENNGLILHRSPEYWSGWSLAYYQWDSCKKFEEINRTMPLDSIIALYSPYHEMDIRQFCDKLDSLIKAKNNGCERTTQRCDDESYGCGR